MFFFFFVFFCQKIINTLSSVLESKEREIHHRKTPSLLQESSIKGCPVYSLVLRDITCNGDSGLGNLLDAHRTFPLPLTSVASVRNSKPLFKIHLEYVHEGTL